MKYIWPSLNTVFVLMLFFYVFVTKDINTQAIDKCQEMELKLNEQEKLTNKLIEETLKNRHDTIIVNIKNYNSQK